ncbi:uncharacterized protein LOC144907114 [Branchiostoma floridae x Branchiostoma belcheri]
MAGRQQDRQTVDVKEYFEAVRKGASNKWDYLADKLGFDDDEIKGIRIDEHSQGHRCREVLNRWRNREGRKATLQVLKQALIDIGERRTAESLEENKKDKKENKETKSASRRRFVRGVFEWE